jgi:hypothetical protein
MTEPQLSSKKQGMKLHEQKIQTNQQFKKFNRMKRQIVIMIIVAVTTVLDCVTAFAQAAAQQIIITVTTDHLFFDIAGSGKVTINWGDGAKSEKTLKEEFSIPGITYDHKYEGAAAERTVTVTGNVKYFSCEGEGVTNLDVSGCKWLVYLHCGKNQLTALDVGKNAALTYLDCSENKLTALDVTANKSLSELHCGINRLHDLDVSNNIILKELGCYGNSLTSLDLSKNIALRKLDCRWNRLTELNTGKSKLLETLYCSSNYITALDLSANTALTSLRCDANKLTALDLSKNAALEELFCDENRLQAAALNAMFASLNSVAKTKNAETGNNPGTKTFNRTAANRKGWTVTAGELNPRQPADTSLIKTLVPLVYKRGTEFYVLNGLDTLRKAELWGYRLPTGGVFVRKTQGGGGRWQDAVSMNWFDCKMFAEEMTFEGKQGCLPPLKLFDNHFKKVRDREREAVNATAKVLKLNGIDAYGYYGHFWCADECDYVGDVGAYKYWLPLYKNCDSKYADRSSDVIAVYFQ